VSDSTASDSIAFSVVNLKRIDGAPSLLRGHKTSTVILDSLTWPSAWRAAVDSAPVPDIPFGDDALMLVATEVSNHGPLGIDINAIRECRLTRAIVVGVQQIVPGGSTSAPEVQRAIRIVRLKRSALAGHQVKFVDLPEQAR
jgi:hypothetical protein